MVLSASVRETRDRKHPEKRPHAALRQCPGHT